MMERYYFFFPVTHFHELSFLDRIGTSGQFEDVVWMQHSRKILMLHFLRLAVILHGAQLEIDNESGEQVHKVLYQTYCGFEKVIQNLDRGSKLQTVLQYIW
jgi:hypothetical protein